MTRSSLPPFPLLRLVAASRFTHHDAATPVAGPYRRESAQWASVLERLCPSLRYDGGVIIAAR